MKQLCIDFTFNLRKQQQYMLASLQVYFCAHLLEVKQLYFKSTGRSQSVSCILDTMEYR